jgi:hypothetical protein
MGVANELLWPTASSPERARWATQAVERHRHMARLIRTRAAARPAGEAPFPAQALDRARRTDERSRFDLTSESRSG